MANSLSREEPYMYHLLLVPLLDKNRCFVMGVMNVWMDVYALSLVNIF